MFLVTDEMKPEGNLIDECLGHVTILETSTASWEYQALPETSLAENSTGDDDLAYSKSVITVMTAAPRS